jgi:hypothetical protein
MTLAQLTAKTYVSGTALADHEQRDSEQDNVVA